MAFLMRVTLPDRPGSLGLVATALGAVAADILSVDVVERAPGVAVDDLVVDIPSGRLPDALVSAAQAVPGVRVESIRPYAGALDTQRELELVEAMTHDPSDAARVLVNGLPRIFRAGWSVLMRTAITGCVIDVASSAAPEPAGTSLPGTELPHAITARSVSESERLPPAFRALDAEVMLSPFGDGRIVVLGRPGGPAFRSSEIARLAHLSGIAATIARDGGHR